MIAPKNIGAGLFAMLMGAVLCFMAYALLDRAIPESNRDAILMMLGIVSANVGQITSYFFGSSQSSREKDATINTMAKGNDT